MVHNTFNTDNSSKVARIAQGLYSRRINIAENYDEWFVVGRVLAHELGEAGRSYFHALSSLSSKYNMKECDKNYRFISENFTSYIEGGDDSVNYARLTDDVITPEIKDNAVKTKGYFIYPSQLFINVVETANTNTNLNTELKDIFNAIESSANSYPSEHDIKGLFANNCFLVSPFSKV